MIESQTKCTFSTDLQFYITGDLGVDGNAPHNFILINGIPLEGNKLFYWYSEFQNATETTVIINTSTAKLKIQLSGSPDLLQDLVHITTNSSSNYQHTSLVILQNYQQAIYNIFNHSSKHICSYWL